MEYWWYVPWPLEVRLHAVRYIKSNKDGELVAINCMEYATELINYAASYYYWVTKGNCMRKRIQYPTVLIMADNKSVIAWAIKGCKMSKTGQALGRLQCALMMNNPVGLSAEYINTKHNCIADDISRFKSETKILLSAPELLQKYPSLGACRRFHPSRELLSYIMDALLLKQLPRPMKVRQLVHKNPGKISGSSIAEM